MNADPEDPRAVTDEGSTVAARLREDITIDGTIQSFPIAAFYEVRDGVIDDVTIYREGSAELPEK